MSYQNYKTSEMQRFLLERYVFRKNIVNNRTEYIVKDRENSGFQEITDYEINSISLQLEKEELPYGTEQLRKLLNSDFVPKYNPFHEYFNSLPTWDGFDYIKQLAETIDTTDKDLFLWVLQKWLVASVASLMNDEVINHTIIVLVGKQGKGKSSWVRKLVPMSLRHYYYEGVLNTKNKDDLFQLAECMLINLDELQSLRPTEIEALKALITSPQVTQRRVYAREKETLPRRASFIGSVNEKQFLTDTTGNRRFLCIEALSINYEHNISIDGAYAQALHLYKAGFQYWFDEEDIERINDNNSSYMSISVEEDLLLKYIEPCSKDDEYALFDTASGILKELLMKDNPDPEKGKGIMTKINTPTAILLGKMLNKHGYQRAKAKNVYGYYYKLKPLEEDIGYGYCR